MSDGKEYTLTMRASGLVYNRPCWFTSMLLGLDRTNDPQITVYDTTNAPVPGTDEEKVPTNTYDASALGLNGVEKERRSYCHYGLYIIIEAPGGGAFGGSAEVVVGYDPGG